MFQLICFDIISFTYFNIYTSIHGNKKNYECELCHLKFGFKRYLLIHAKGCQKSDQSSSSSSSLQCKICEKKFVEFRHWRDHVKSVHAKSREHSCKICGIKFGYSSNVTKHVRKFHGGNNPILHSDNLEMTIRNKEINKIGTSEEAKKNVDPKKDPGDKVILKKVTKYSCKICGAKIWRKKLIDKHIRNYHGETSEDFIIAQSTEEKVSKKQIRNVKDKMCSRCPRFFVKTENLLKHIENVHNNVKGSISLQIGKENIKKDQPILKTEEKQKCSLQSKQCSICNKLFRTKFSLVNIFFYFD